MDAEPKGGPQVEPHLAVDPRDPSRLVTAAFPHAGGGGAYRVRSLAVAVTGP